MSCLIAMRKNSPATSEIIDNERPLTARSVVASTLLGIEPPRLPAKLLVRTGALFGIADGTTRVAISRMAANGELVGVDGGWQLAGSRLTARRTRQLLSRRGERRAWDGEWHLAVVVADDRGPTERLALRRAASALRLAERREGVWLRPHNLTEEHDNVQANALEVLDSQCDRFIAYPDFDATVVTAMLWPLDDWAGKGRTLLEAISELSEPLENGDEAAIPSAFVVSAAVLRHFQADPLLPDELLPDGWPGTELRTAYERFDAAFKAAWTTWFRTQP